MRRKEKEIIDISEIEEIILRCTVCRLGMSDDNQPYVVPLSFGYKDRTLYFHSSREGKKLDVLKKNDRVCVEFDIGDEIIKTDRACNWGFKFKSVIGYGRASFIDDYESKCRAFNIIMQHYSGDSSAKYEYKKSSLDDSIIIKIEIENLTGKKSG